MKIKVILDKEGFVEIWSSGDLTGTSTATELRNEDFNDFTKNFKAYRINNGKLEKDAEKAKLVQSELLKLEIRQQRKRECFPIINRGTLWYEALTAEQKEELATWYKAWLDATETSIIPTIPAWIKIEEV